MTPVQMTLSTEQDASFALHHEPTQREMFLAEMDRVVPWPELCAVIEPFCPKPRADGGGCPPVVLERMLRIHFLQQWHTLSDPAVEEALIDSQRCAASSASISAGSGRRTRPRSAHSGMCWRNTAWPRSRLLR